MSDLLDKAICLKLNRNWNAVGIKTVRDAFTDLTSIRAGETETSALAMDLDFEVNEDGSLNYDRPIVSNPTEWMDWITLPIRPFDLTINTSRGQIRVPTILISRYYAGMPIKTAKPSGRTIKERDKGICQVTGKYVGDRGNLGHIIPKSKGGKVTFTNAAWMDRDINTRMGNRTPDEAGMPLIRKPFEPKPVPISATIREAKHPTWAKFITPK